MVKEIVDEFKTLDPTQIVDGIKKIIDLINHGLEDIDVCKEASSDLDEVEKWAQNVVAHPSKIINNSLKHITAIIGGVRNAVKDYSEEKYDEAGDNIAEVVVDMLGKVSDEFTEEPINWDLIF